MCIAGTGVKNFSAQLSPVTWSLKEWDTLKIYITGSATMGKKVYLCTNIMNTTGPVGFMAYGDLWGYNFDCIDFL